MKWQLIVTFKGMENPFKQKHYTEVSAYVSAMMLLALSATNGFRQVESVFIGRIKDGKDFGTKFWFGKER